MSVRHLTSPTISGDASWDDKQFDHLLTHELHNWAARQNPPASIRTRLMHRARLQQNRSKTTLICKQLFHPISQPSPTANDLSVIATRFFVNPLRLGLNSLRLVS